MSNMHPDHGCHTLDVAHGAAGSRPVGRGQAPSWHLNHKLHGWHPCQVRVILCPDGRGSLYRNPTGCSQNFRHSVIGMCSNDAQPTAPHPAHVLPPLYTLMVTVVCLPSSGRSSATARRTCRQ